MGGASMKNRLSTYKIIVISVASLLVVTGGVTVFRFYSISEDFSAFTGMKAVFSLLTGNEIIEVTGNTNNQILMVKSDDKTDTYITHFASKGYTCTDAEDNSLSCQKGAETFLATSAMYTSHFVTFELLKNENTTN